MRFWPEHTRVLLEIFKGEYAMNIPAPKVIFDLGANLGYASLYFAWKYPHAQIYSFEPDPYAFKKLCRNTRWFSRIHPLSIAVSDVDGEADFYSNRVSISSSLVRREGECVKVPCAKLSTLCACYGTPGLIKFDVEGAEASVFKAFDTSRVEYYVGEHHEDLTHMSTGEFCTFFAGKTSDIRAIAPHRTLCKFYPSTAGVPLKVPTPASSELLKR